MDKAVNQHKMMAMGKKIATPKPKVALKKGGLYEEKPEKPKKTK